MAKLPFQISDLTPGMTLWFVGSAETNIQSASERDIDDGYIYSATVVDIDVVETSAKRGYEYTCYEVTFEEEGCSVYLYEGDNEINNPSIYLTKAEAEKEIRDWYKESLVEAANDLVRAQKAFEHHNARIDAPLLETTIDISQVGFRLSTIKAAIVARA